MARDYNNIYRILVKDRSDMVGRIAYSLYKEEKINWITDFRSKNKRKPTDEELESMFCGPHRHKDCIDRYRLHAESILQEFTDAALEETTTQIETECYNKIDERLSGVIDDFSKQLPEREGLFARYFHGSIQSVIGTVLLALLVWLLVAVVGKFDISDLEIVFKMREPQKVENTDSIPQKNIPIIKPAPKTGH